MAIAIPLIILIPSGSKSWDQICRVSDINV